MQCGDDGSTEVVGEIGRCLAVFSAESILTILNGSSFDDEVVMMVGVWWS